MRNYINRIVCFFLGHREPYRACTRCQKVLRVLLIVVLSGCAVTKKPAAPVFTTLQGRVEICFCPDTAEFTSAPDLYFKADTKNLLYFGTKDSIRLLQAGTTTGTVTFPSPKQPHQ